MVLFHHQAALQTDRLALPLSWEFWTGDFGGDRHRQAALLPACQPLLCFDDEDEEAAAGDAKAAGTLQGRSDGAPERDDGALQAREGEPDRRMLADPDSDPRLLLALQ